jgi:UDP-2-acetamido-2,6-beta-L-arabino-hexul-4-ose reductase
MKIGITGGDGFIGYHTYYNLKYTTDWDVIKLDRAFYNDKRIKECDWIIHLTGINRGDENKVYKGNIDLTQLLLDSVKIGCNIIFSSSTQVELNNSYGDCKLECEQMIQNWCQQYGGKFYNLRIPNVFGPFCKPNYNSFVATFCHNLCNDKDIKITNDDTVNLIYVNDVVEEFKNCIEGKTQSFKTTEMTVSDVSELLSYFNDCYFEDGRIPNLNNDFDRNLFNTFISYIPDDKRLIKTELHSDDRGSLTELAKVDSSEGQVFFSTTNKGYVRGEHFHMRKFERFCVVDGKAVIRIRKMGSDKVCEYKVSGEDIKVIDMPVLHTHNLENVGQRQLTTVFWISEIYDDKNPDTFFEEI